MAVLPPKRIEFGSQMFSAAGVVRDASGTAVMYEDFLEWHSPSGIKGNVTELNFAAGSWAESFEYQARTLTINGFIYGYTEEAVLARKERIIADIPRKFDVPLVFHHGGKVQHLMVRNAGEQHFEPIGKAKGSGLVLPFTMNLLALSPTKLSGAGTGYTKGPANGLVTPKGVAGSITVTNSGDGDFPPTLVRVTDCVDPVLTHSGSTQRFELTVPSGQWLEVDFAAASVRLAGTNVRGKMRGFWLDLPDKKYTINFNATTIGPNGRMEIYTYDSFV